LYTIGQIVVSSVLQIDFDNKRIQLTLDPHYINSSQYIRKKQYWKTNNILFSEHFNSFKYGALNFALN